MLIIREKSFGSLAGFSNWWICPALESGSPRLSPLILTFELQTHSVDTGGIEPAYLPSKRIPKLYSPRDPHLVNRDTVEITGIEPACLVPNLVEAEGLEPF